VRVKGTTSASNENLVERVKGSAETASKLQREASQAVSIPPEAPVESLVTQFERREGRKELLFNEFK
jgi:hypothetical protein